MKKLNKKGKELLDKFKQLNELADEFNIEFEADSYDMCPALQLSLIVGGEVDEEDTIDIIEEHELEEYFE